MSQKSLLMVAYHFPPDEAIGGARPFRFFKYAPRFGYEPAVVTAAAQSAPHPDVHYVPDPFTERPRSVEWHCERVLRRFALPGEVGSAWSRHVAALCNTLIESAPHGRPLVLFSTFPPLGAHLAAMQVARAKQVCWVADFRDPYVPSRMRNFNWFSAAVATRIEWRMASEPALLVVNTDAAAEEWKRRYPAAAHKVRVIWNGFDPAHELIAPPQTPRQLKTWIHTGELYGGRHAAPIFESVERLVRSQRLSQNAIRLRFVGECDSSALIPAEVIESGTREGWIEITNRRVPAAAATALACESDGLILLQPHTTTQVPGKLFDYIRIGRPILAFIARNSPIETILANSGIPHAIIYPGDHLERVDEELLRFHSLPAGPSAPSEWFQQTFDGIEQTRTLCALMDEALDSGSGRYRATR